MNSAIQKPSGQPYGDSIIVDNERVYLKIGNDWYFYFKRRAHVGTGGMGCVLMGYSLTNRTTVAIKRINPELSSRRNIRERIRLESRLTFAHPNLVETIGCCEGPEENGPLFVVSKYIQGQTIDVYVDSTFATDEERIRHVIPLLRQLASAVDFIHSKGITHLDIKPSNIMIERGSTVKLLDLGIADVAEHRLKTQGYGIHGTPGYAAPEQHLDERNPVLDVNAKTDIFGLAATAYSLITGHTPNKATAEDYSLVRKSMQQVFTKALDKEKDNRHDSAGSFVDDLAKAIDKDYSRRTAYPWVRIIILLCAISATIVLACIIL